MSLVMLEEARNKLRIKLLMDMLAGDWHCGGKKGRHRPDWLTEFMHRAGSPDQRPIASVSKSLDQDATFRSDDWDSPDPTEKNRVFQSVAAGCEKHHRDEGGLCLQCAMAGGAHQDHE